MSGPRVALLGSKSIGERALATLIEAAPGSVAGVITIDDADDTRSRLQPILDLAARHGVKTHIAADRADTAREIQWLGPDIVLVAGWYWLLDAATLAMVPRGCIGIHNSLLPRFRGGSPLVWTMLAGEPEAGASIFTLTPGMDDGPVWAQVRVPVGEDGVGEVLARLEAATIRRLAQLWPAILSGTVHPVPQEEDAATYCLQRHPEDGEIDWSQPAWSVVQFVRAQTEPYPGAFTFAGGEVLRVWRVEPFAAPVLGMPGRVARINGPELLVACGDGRAVVLADVELHGRRGTGSQVLRGAGGVRLGRAGGGA